MDLGICDGDGAGLNAIPSVKINGLPGGMDSKHWFS